MIVKAITFIFYSQFSIDIKYPFLYTFFTGQLIFNL